MLLTTCSSPSRAANRLKERAQEVSGFRFQVSGSDSPLTSHSSPLTAESDDVIFLKTDYRVVKVTISEIRYIEAMSEYLKIFIEGEAKPIVTLLSMKKMEEKLPENFMRIHRSYIVNLTKIQEINKNRIIMDTETFLPIGDMYKEAFQKYIDTKFLGK